MRVKFEGTHLLNRPKPEFSGSAVAEPGAVPANGRKNRHGGGRPVRLYKAESYTELDGANTRKSHERDRKNPLFCNFLSETRDRPCRSNDTSSDLVGVPSRRDGRTDTLSNRAISHVHISGF